MKRSRHSVLRHSGGGSRKERNLTPAENLSVPLSGLSFLVSLS